MAEEEIAKHTKKIYRTLKNKEENWLHKFKEILAEVLIIVFAVTISIWFHNWSDELHQKKEEKEFLTGLKKDINADLVNLNTSFKFYKFTVGGFSYFIKAGNGMPINKDSVSKYTGIFFSSTDLEPHTSRYEGLKGSNNFSIIENKDLLNDIIDLHESTFARINTLDRYYHDDISNKIVPFISVKVQLSDKTGIANAGEVVKTSEMRILMITMQSLISGNLLSAHQNAINECNEIIKKIDRELN